MKQYLDLLLIENINIEDKYLSNSLFISFDKASALRKDYKNVVSLLKKYNSYEILKQNIRSLHEGYSQGLFIIKLMDKNIFIRIVLSNEEIYDALVYTIKDMDFINRVFFSTNEISIPNEYLDKLDNKKAVVILNKEDNDYRILKANPRFYELIKYEDWDFDNKYQNILNQKAIDSIDLNQLRLYRSDNTPIIIECDYENKEDIYCLMEK